VSVVETEPRPVSRGARIATLLGVHDAGRALRDFATYLPTQVIPALAGFMALPVLARRLAPTELGVLAIAQTLITLGSSVSGMWLTSALMREYPAARERGSVPALSATLLRGLGLTAAAFAGFTGLLALASLVSSAIAVDLWYVVAASGGLLVHSVAVTLYAARLRPRAYAAVDLLARTGGIILGVVLVFQGQRVHGYLVGLAVASWAAGGIGLLFAWPRPMARTPSQSLRPWLAYGLPVTIASVLTWALLLVDRYLLAGLKSASAVGIYTVGNILGDKAVAIPTFAFFVAARPLLIRAYEQRGREGAESLVRAYTRIVLLVGVPAVAASWLVAKDIVFVIAGNGVYYKAAPVVPIVAAGSLIYALTLFGNAGLVVSRQSRPLIYASAIALALNVGANLLLIPPLGIKGAAIATPVGNAAFLVAAQYWSRRYATWRFPFATLARTAAAAALGLGAARLLLFLEQPLASITVRVVAFAVVYVVALWALGERKASA
jgi:O-antigen/teichoic acid export membrane protein